MAEKMAKKKIGTVDIKMVKPVEPTTLSTGDMERLKDHFRLLKGLEIKKIPIKKYFKVDKKIIPKLNTTYAIRKLCIKRRTINTEECFHTEVKQREKIIYANRIGEVRKKPRQQFNLNKAFHLRWKNTRGFPILNSFYEESALKTGKPPFAFPVHYKPFNAYWEADWAEQEFIFLDDNTGGSSTTPAPKTGTAQTTSLPSAITQDPSAEPNVVIENTSTTNIPSEINTTGALGFTSTIKVPDEASKIKASGETSMTTVPREISTTSQAPGEVQITNFAPNLSGISQIEEIKTQVLLAV